MEDGSSPSSPSTIPVARLVINDSATALGQQMKVIFENLQSAPDTRPMRIEECLCALMDTLVSHAEEIAASEGLQEILFILTEKIFEDSISKGVQAFFVVFDMQWGDQHEKRSHCLDLLLRQANRCMTQADCAPILDAVAEVLQENIRSTTDLLGEYLSLLTHAMKDSITVESQAVSCEILARVVVTAATTIKRNPNLLELLTGSCPPLVLLQMAVTSSNQWYRTALIRLLTILVEENCYEVSAPTASLIADAVKGYMEKETEEGQLVGVLSIITGVVTSPTFSHTAWDYNAICNFLTKRDWLQFSTETRALAAYTTGKACYLLFIKEDALYDKVAHRLLDYIRTDTQDVVSQALEILNEILQSERGIRNVPNTVAVLRDCIERLPFMPLVFRVIEGIRARYGDAQVGPIYDLIDKYMSMDMVLVNFGKLNALLRFMGHRAPLHREDILNVFINLSPSRPVEVLIRSLPLLTTLGRVTQLDDVIELMFHDDAGVRSAAITTMISLCLIIIRETPTDAAVDVNNQVDPQQLNSKVSGAVEKLLDVAVADRNRDLRLEALSRLPESFNAYLCLPDNLDALFMARNDIFRAVRDEALIRICRVHPYHPAIVHPQLLRAQEYMLRDIEAQDGSVSLVVYSAGLLKMCADHDALLIEPKLVEAVILSRLRLQPFLSKSLSISLMELLRSILEHSGAEHHCEPALLLQTILAIINDGESSKRRRVALETLSAILTTYSQTDAVVLIDVYRTIARILRYEAEEEKSVTIAAMKALSTIGAASPVKIRRIIRVIESDEIEEEEEAVTPALAHYKPRLRIHPNMTDRYPSVVLYYLVKALQFTIDPRQQVETLNTVRSLILEIPGNQRAMLLTQFLPQLQSWLKEPDKAYLYENVLTLMGDLAVLLPTMKAVIPSSVGYDLLHAVQQFCALPQASQKPLNARVVQLLDDLGKCLPAREMRDHRWAVEFIHQRLSQDKNDLDLIQRVVKSLESFMEVMHEKDLQLILPHVLRCIEPAKVTTSDARGKMHDVNAVCFDFIHCVMVKQVSLVRNCCAQIVHTIMWYIGLSDSQEEKDVGLHTLAYLVNVVKRPALRFMRPINRVAQQNGYPEEYFALLVERAATGVAVRAPLNTHNTLHPSKPISIVSQLPRLLQRDFEAEITRTLHLSEADFVVTDVSYLAGQTTIILQFSTDHSVSEGFNLFVESARDSKSILNRKLGILSVEQSVTPLRPVHNDILNTIASFPSTKSRKQEQLWIAWLHNTSLALLRNSPYASLRCSCSVAIHNSDLSRDLFPFAAASIIGQLEACDRSRLMNIFNQALAVSPYDIKKVLYCLAEFMEAERGEPRAKLVTVSKQITRVVEREQPDHKFGINYDQDSAKGVIVTKLAPDGNGARAGVPVGARLLAINGTPIKTVGDIRGQIEGLTRIELSLLNVVKEYQRPERKVLMCIEALANVAFDSEMHAKAIYFNEVLFTQLVDKVSEDSSRKDASLRRALSVAERLIQFYNHLNLTMVANGLVNAITKKFSDNIIAPEYFGFDEVGTLERLHWWSQALSHYKARMINPENNQLDVSSFVGALRCEDALGHAHVINDMIEAHWQTLSEEAKREVAPYRARAALSMGAWHEFDEMTQQSSLAERFGVVEHCAALFRTNQYSQLLSFTKSRREDLLEPFSQSFNESYSRSYDLLVELQSLTHFEELVSFVHSGPERRHMLKTLWHKRLLQASNKSDNLTTLITINSLVLTPREDLASQVVAIRSLTKMQWHTVAAQMCSKLIAPTAGKAELCGEDPELLHAYMKHRYVTADRMETYALLRDILQLVEVAPDDPKANTWGLCWLLLGEWTMSLFHDRGDVAIEELLRATELSPENYAAFHSLGILHYDLSRDPGISLDVQTDHHISAVIALFKSVQLCSYYTNSAMQDVLRILSIWFAHSHVGELNEAVHEGAQIIPNHVWLSVVPQLIARIGITAKLARAILADLLVRVGIMYPQALIYPLTVAEKSPDAIRRLMAERVLAGIRTNNNQIVEEASLISNEMVRIAIIWTEKWYTAIQQAAYKPGDFDAVLRRFQPLYEELEHPATPNERNFERLYGHSLRRARAALQEKAIDRAWAYLKQVYVQLNKTLGERCLHMGDVSPTLNGIRDSIVAVPGTFAHGKPLVTIHRFHSQVYVMPSKQKPRRFGIDASSGAKYRFLLKGHEDMRQDERVMQFIGLIDTIFLSDNAATAIGLTIPQYAVIPLTDNVGIVGWVENTETIYKMLETYRQENDISIYEEVLMITNKGQLRNIEEYHRLPKQQRKSLLSYTFANTPDDEVRRIIWERNDSCEQWLGYRGSYGYTLAAMSMVGYVLGLGDRHLNNLMLGANGNVVHIDFGDCFEVAMHRSLYAEAVPFRLTRLLVAALGITGVDGVYRSTCELVMKNLRRHSENLLSILEAFIYDPLINWRLVANEADKSLSRSGNPEAGQAPEAKQAVLADPLEPHAEPPPMQLSRSIAKHTQLPEGYTGAQTLNPGEEETRNQQGDLALARVHAKLNGLDFSAANNSFSLKQSARRKEEDSSLNASWGSNSAFFNGGSPKESIAAPLLTTYLSARSIPGNEDALDVHSQVDRLIQEATSLDNLADAYLTGWAPFW